MSTQPSPDPTYYEILNLSQSAVSSSPEPGTLIKRAYRRALLSHHPDKTRPPHPHSPNSTSQPPPPPPAAAAAAPGTTTFTIDQISAAYATLSRPSQRAAYDRTLLLRSQSSQPLSPSQRTRPDFQTGIETVDLDDLDCEEFTNTTTAAAAAAAARGAPPTTTTTTTTTTRWYRACRCGNPRGYLFDEADLEDAADLGELMVGCADCSLWLRVHFAVVDDEAGEGDHERGG
ncbi:hypothetical protein VTK26DRAFT_5297 [Humicola hyalothermophila]